MTPYAVLFTPRAEQQLDDLFAYIASSSGEERAESFVSRIVSDCMSLSVFPERGNRRDDLKPNLRTKGFERCATIAFAVDHATRIVTVHGVFYGGQDFEIILG